MHFKETFTLNMDYVKILHIRGSLIKLHQNIPFYDLFPFMCFKQCFMKDFIIFYCFEVWYISPLNTWKQQDLTLRVFMGEKCKSSNEEKIGENPLLELFLFTCQDLLFWQKAWYDTMYNFQKKKF